MGIKDLAAELRDARELRGWTLKKLEQETKISNGYLSLLEQGKIKEPSPNMLMRLAKAFEMNYKKLMELAGYLNEQPNEESRKDSVGLALSSAILSLTPEERQEVETHLKLIRARHHKPKSK